MRLLHRTTRRISLTEAGAAYYRRCARIVAEAEFYGRPHNQTNLNRFVQTQAFRELRRGFLPFTVSVSGTTKIPA